MESNIAKIVFKYFPQQTMTLNESELLRRLLFFSDVLRDPRLFLGIFNGIDFSNWNLGHTSPLAEPFFKFLDQIFGTPGLFIATHWFFEQCDTVMASYLNPPSTLINHPTGEPQECNELWYGHAGGFEGLRQKGWTIITIALLLYVEHLIGTKSYIIGQGDNQVCKGMIPVPEGYASVENYLESGGEDLDRKIALFLDPLTKAAAKIGLTVKPDETCTSRNLIIYGKDILYKGAFMPQALKRISRTLPDVNEIYPTLETEIATVQTSGSASSQKSLDYVVPYIVSTTETLVVMMREFYYLHRKQISTNRDYKILIDPKFKDFLLHLSSEVGGRPILNPLHFLYMGHPDHFTAYTTFLDKVASFSEYARRMYNALSLLRLEFGNADPELLVSNPYSVNLKAPKTISNLIRRDLEQILIAVTQNKDLAQIFTENAQSGYDLF
jgi:hypothetical protein